VTENTVTVAEPRSLDLALLKAVGLDRAQPEQRELAIAIADRYGLDLMLKHLVLIEGRPYVTRDALLHIAHRSGQFDGIAVTEPTVIDGYWRCSATVYRRDMTHPFTYPGRYPTTGGNQKFAPEMAIKVAESMALRRAFNVAAPVVEERWDTEAPYEPPPPKQTLAERAATRAAEITAPATADGAAENTPGPAAPESATPAESLAKTPEQAAADVAVRRAARVATVPAEPEGLFPAPADDGLVASAMALAAEQRVWKEGDVHTPGHKGLIRNARGLFCATKLTDGKWCQWTERSA